MKIALCTISSKSHLFKVQTMFSSLNSFFEGDLFCLVTDMTEPIKENLGVFENLKQIESKLLNDVTTKYKGDKLRWTLKPIYLKNLIERGYDNVIYVDNDVYFFKSPTHLFELLNKSSVLLTPHFYPSDPKSNQNWFEANFRVGLYNAGFIGVNRNAIPMLEWWRDCCLYNVKKSFWRGLFDDQKYLDLIPIIFDDVYVIKDTGCNLAGWNYEHRIKNLGDANLNTVVFVHFANITFQRFSLLCSPFYSLYVEYIKEIKKINPLFTENYSNYSKRNILAYFYFLIWKLARWFD